MTAVSMRQWIGTHSNTISRGKIQKIVIPNARRIDVENGLQGIVGNGGQSARRFERCRSNGREDDVLHSTNVIFCFGFDGKVDRETTGKREVPLVEWKQIGLNGACQFVV